ncbi:hypothetical protein MIMGU_mgv1a0234092mg, partial [Erythranthe guttata]
MEGHALERETYNQPH